MEDNLEYRIGGVAINPNRIKFNGSDPYDADHKFIVQIIDSQVLIYVAPANRHFQVAHKFNLDDKNLIGGGSCFIDAGEQLVLDDYSGDYMAIPREAAKTFAELLVPELLGQGIQTKGVIADPLLSKLHKFWIEKGYR